MTLAEALEEAAAELTGTAARTTDSGTEWFVHGRLFAAVTDGAAEFLLAPEVARAARGTPDTAASVRGGDWIAFTPGELDRFALDRAVAWFGSAHRHARG